MSAELKPEVERRLESPTSGETATLILGVTAAHSESVRDQLKSAGAQIEDVLPCNYVAASVSEKNLSQVCSLDVVTSAEIEGTGSTLDDVNL
jgi:hypothetical protein